MKNPKNPILKKVSKGLVKTLANRLPVVREVKDFIDNVKESDDETKMGQVNWFVTIPSVVVSSFVLYVFYKGLISFDEVLTVLDYFFK